MRTIIEHLNTKNIAAIQEILKGTPPEPLIQSDVERDKNSRLLMSISDFSDEERFQLTDWFIQNETDIEDRNHMASLLFYWAIRFKQQSIVEKLIDSKIMILDSLSPDKKPWLALMIEHESSFTNFDKMLAYAGIHPDHADKDGNTPLHYVSNSTQPLSTKKIYT